MDKPKAIALRNAIALFHRLLDYQGQANSTVKESLPILLGATTWLMMLPRFCYLSKFNE
ncbi:hypothetical protein LC613_36575 [Nostoc sphaeroides CHAB 2801]|uniref:hypothetical protein n=1 Tax=Nostoc sphaeroides TaxID=446679 RepID=UPI001E41A6E0|nr:hypothetical protein [Nostoc sphaeroides]MCC5633041.1 hypothetical protein [Nostoc sphaeroides CHAB 2801]